MRLMLSDPTGQIERECADKVFDQKSVAMTYALAIRDEADVPVDWKRANEAIRRRWPKGLQRVKQAAWRLLEAQARRIEAAQVSSVAVEKKP